MNTYIQCILAWRATARQRRQLRELARAGFDFSDIGMSRVAAVREAAKWPWQRWDPAWSEPEPKAIRLPPIPRPPRVGAAASSGGRRSKPGAAQHRAAAQIAESVDR